jgi:hypothetical protein
MIEMSRPLRRVRPAEKKIQESLANEWKTQNYKYFERSLSRTFPQERENILWVKRC